MVSFELNRKVTLCFASSTGLPEFSNFRQTITPYNQSSECEFIFHWSICWRFRPLTRGKFASRAEDVRKHSMRYVKDLAIWVCEVPFSTAHLLLTRSHVKIFVFIENFS